MLLDLHPDNPQPRNLKMVVECLNDGGVVIYPTDTIYGIGCDILNTKAIEKICRLKGLQPNKANLSFICQNLSELSNYTRNISNPIYRILRSALPGPYTFILEASRQVPKILKTKKDTVGIRVPDHIICQNILEGLGRPILSTSIPMGEEVEYYTDPEMMYERFKNQVDIVINSGIGSMVASTVVDCTEGEVELIREGLGPWPIP